MAVKLSVLIATIPNRQNLLIKLIKELDRQRIAGEIQICFDELMIYNIGTKRNKLLQQATGEYIVFIDDDDEIAPNYIELILNAIKTGPDCIGISGTITTNGKNERQWHISKDYGSWYTRNGVYYRTPNHISPVKRELALLAGFPNMSFGEDHSYSMRLLPLLKTEVIIPQNIYHYKYATK